MQATFFGTNAGIITGRPQLTCDPKSGLVKYQLYRPCFTAAAFGSPGGYGLPFIAGQAYMENDLALSKTFTVHEHHKLKFTASAFNWLNHPLPTFGSGESTTEYYFYNYTTHALTVNDTAQRRRTLPDRAIRVARSWQAMFTVLQTAILRPVRHSALQTRVRRQQPAHHGVRTEV